MVIHVIDVGEEGGICLPEASSTGSEDGDGGIFSICGLAHGLELPFCHMKGRKMEILYRVEIV